MLGITFLLLLQIFANQGAYFVAETKSSWSGDKNCSIATPPLQFANGTITTDISNLQLADNATIWVGYYTSLVEFVYFGCVRSNELGTAPHRGVTIGDPGQCYSACPKPLLHIGVCKNKCYCFYNVPGSSISTTTAHGCDSHCNTQPGIACGGEDTDGVQYVSLYRSIKQPIEEVQVQENVNADQCLASIGGESLIWDQCNSEFLVMCYAGNDVWQSDSQLQQEHFDWITSAGWCFMNNSRPTTVTNSQSVGVISTAPLWTGIMRSWVVFNSDVKATHTRIQYGYITYKVSSTSNTYALTFTDADSPNTVLCVTGSEHTSADNADSNIIVPVSVSLFAFIIAVSIIVTLLVLMKRGTIPYLFQYSKDPNTSQQPEPDYNDPDFNLPDDAGNIHKYLDCAVSSQDLHVSESAEQEETNHDYSVLEEHEKELDSLDSLETDYDEIEDGNTRLNRGINNASYDHTFINGHSAISDNDNTYDTSVTSAIKANGIANDTGNIYNTTEKAEDDTYNHVNMKACTNDKQDNAYCVSNGQPGGDNDDIYNSTSDNCSSCTPTTDNTYSKLKAVT